MPCVCWYRALYIVPDEALFVCLVRALYVTISAPLSKAVPADCQCPHHCHTVTQISLACTVPPSCPLGQACQPQSRQEVLGELWQHNHSHHCSSGINQDTNGAITVISDTRRASSLCCKVPHDPGDIHQLLLCFLLLHMQQCTRHFNRHSNNLIDVVGKNSND